jgi:hypothetical protein
MWQFIAIPGTLAVAGGVLIAGRQLIALSSRPLRQRAWAVAHRHRKVQGQDVKERRTAWHTFRIGVFAILCGAAGLASGYHAVAPSWWVLPAGSAAAVLIWDRVRWLRSQQQRRTLGRSATQPRPAASHEQRNLHAQLR